MKPSRVTVTLAGLALMVGVQTASAQSKYEIQQMDRNGDGIVTRAEWQGPEGAFRLHDTNKDGVLSGNEVFDRNDRGDRVERFREFDRNNDGVISRNEWRGTTVAFRNLDRNRDNRISRREFRQFREEAVGTSGRDNNENFQNAYMAGYERGWSEGMIAGREDYDRNQGWDVEGQRELESADSGYNPRFGSRAQYQEGYRDGFRAAYTEGWFYRRR